MADVEIERLRARVAELEELRTGVQLVMGLGSETDNESLLAAVARVYERADAAESLLAAVARVYERADAAESYSLRLPASMSAQMQPRAWLPRNPHGLPLFGASKGVMPPTPVESRSRSMSDDTPEQDRFVWARAEWDSFENPEDRDLSYVQEDVQSVLARTKKAEARVMELEKERAAGLEVIRKHAETIRQTIKRAEEAEADVVRARMMVDSSHEMLFTRMEAAEARVVELEKAARDLADSVTRYCAMKDGHISRVTIDRLQDQRLQMRRLARKAQEI